MKRFLLRFGLLALLGFSALWLFLWWTVPRVNRKSYDRIENGMSKSEVLSILNCKPCYAPGEVQWPWAGPPAMMKCLQEGYGWRSSEGAIFVRFSDDETVDDKRWCDVIEESLVQRIRRWFGATQS